MVNLPVKLLAFLPAPGGLTVDPKRCVGAWAIAGPAATNMDAQAATASTRRRMDMDPPGGRRRRAGRGSCARSQSSADCRSVNTPRIGTSARYLGGPPETSRARVTFPPASLGTRRGPDDNRAFPVHRAPTPG